MSPVMAMIYLGFLSRIYKSCICKAAHDARLIPPSAKHRSQCEDPDYEDAVLDARLTRFMRSEYGQAHPPQDSFLRTMRLIRHRTHAKPAPNSTVERPRPALPPLRLAVTLTADGAARMVSGGIALTLLLMVVGSNLPLLYPRQALHSTHDGPAAVSTAYNDSAWQYTVEYRKRPTSVRIRTLEQGNRSVYNKTNLLRNDPPETLVPPPKANGFYIFYDQPVVNLRGLSKQ